MSFTNFFNKKQFKYLKENKDKPIRYAIVNDQVKKAFNDFASLVKNENYYSIIGGLAISKYNEPRTTADIDIIVKDEMVNVELGNVLKSKFKRIRLHAIEHKQTGVELEILTPNFLNTDKTLINKAINSSENDNGINVVNIKYLIALKLKRAIDTKNLKSHQDKFDIINLINNYGEQDLSDLNMESKELELYKELLKEIND